MVHTAARKAFLCTLVDWGVESMDSTLSRLAFIKKVFSSVYAAYEVANIETILEYPKEVKLDSSMTLASSHSSQSDKTWLQANT